MERTDLKKLIAEAREIAESLDEFADKYADKLKEIAAEKVDKHKYSNNSFPHFMEECTEDDLEESEDKK